MVSAPISPPHRRPGHQGSWMAGRPNPWPDLRDRVLFVLSRGREQDRHFWRRIHPERSAYSLLFEPAEGFRLVPLPPLD